jgi:hypothetical protein
VVGIAKQNQRLPDGGGVKIGFGRAPLADEKRRLTRAVEERRSVDALARGESERVPSTFFA